MPQDPDHDAIRITTVRQSPAVGLARRQRRYLISMAIRTACVVGAVALGPGWLRWVLIAGAVALPQIAVIAANAVDSRGTDLELQDAALVARQLPAGPADRR